MRRWYFSLNLKQEVFIARCIASPPYWVQYCCMLLLEGFLPVHCRAVNRGKEEKFKITFWGRVSLEFIQLSPYFKSSWLVILPFRSLCTISHPPWQSSWWVATLVLLFSDNKDSVLLLSSIFPAYLSGRGWSLPKIIWPRPALYLEFGGLYTVHVLVQSISSEVHEWWNVVQLIHTAPPLVHYLHLLPMHAKSLRMRLEMVKLSRAVSVRMVASALQRN